MDGDLWHCTGGVIKIIPKKEKCKKAKWLSEEALKTAEKWREIEESRENHYTIQVWPKSNTYDYTVEVRNRFKGLDLLDRVPDELWTEVRDIVQETVIKTIPMEKK